MTINDFKPGDLLVITSRNRNGEERRAAQVSCVNYNGNGLVTYTPPDVSRDRYAKVFGADVTMDTGSGAFDPGTLVDDGRRAPGQPCYGLCVKVEKVGHQKLWHETRWYPKPGDPGYDLMH